VPKNRKNSAVTSTPNPVFLWPEPVKPDCADFCETNLILAAKAAPAYELDAVERAIGEMFAVAPPVLFSSGRAGLSALIELVGLRRADEVWVPAYSSHCVLEAISRGATPTRAAGNAARAQAALLYHQWGYRRSLGMPLTGPVIDDCVDSFFSPGISPFRGDQSYALWSLSKILGTWAGGAVFVREPGQASALRELRERRRGRVEVQAVHRLKAFTNPLLYDQWAGAESLGGAPCTALLESISQALPRYPDLFRSVVVRAHTVAAALTEKELMPFVEANTGSTGKLEIAPSNLALIDPRFLVPSPLMRVLSAGVRHFPIGEMSADTLVRALPLPLHGGVPDATFEWILRALAS
jgi:putative PLP-dependent aminotransferase (TIGR04422 family)